jgi:hypothetical protein
MVGSGRGGKADEKLPSGNGSVPLMSASMDSVALFDVSLNDRESPGGLTACA